VVVWYLDLQLPVQSVPITKCAEVVSSNPIHGEVHSIQRTFLVCNFKYNYLYYRKL
jgi:hypothetical protein